MKGKVIDTRPASTFLNDSESNGGGRPPVRRRRAKIISQCFKDDGVVFRRREDGSSRFTTWEVPEEKLIAIIRELARARGQIARLEAQVKHSDPTRRKVQPQGFPPEDQW